MSKSRNNAVAIRASEEETSRLIKRAKTDSDQEITYDPENRPEVANLLRIASLTTGRSPSDIVNGIGGQGAAKLKELVVDALNAYLTPIRTRRREIERDPGYVREVLVRGTERAREEGARTLDEVRQVMNMVL
jgi:tryptophanyl-tRNA synthetase